MRSGRRPRWGWAFLAILPWLGGCSWAQLLAAVNWSAATQAVRSEREQAYGAHPRQHLDLYRPRQGQGPFPAVLFLYGGFWVDGAKADYAFVGRALAEAGILTAVADYRLYPEASYPAFVQDGAQALAWLHRHHRRLGLDPERIFVVGHSAGAYNAAMLAMNPRFAREAGLPPAPLRGWVGLAGPYDFVPESLPFPRAQAEAMFPAPQGWAQTQALTHASPEDPPALLLHGLPDATVWPQHTETLAARLRHHGVPVEVGLWPGVGHAELVGAFARPLRWLCPTWQRVVDFVQASAPRP